MTPAPRAPLTAGQLTNLEERLEQCGKLNHDDGKVLIAEIRRLQGQVTEQQTALDAAQTQAAELRTPVIAYPGPVYSKPFVLPGGAK